MRHFIFDAWLKHQRDTIPSYAFPAYVRDHRLTFYAGAGAVLAAIRSALLPAAEGGQVDSQVLSDLIQEMNQFVEELKDKLPKAHDAKNN